MTETGPNESHGDTLPLLAAAGHPLLDPSPNQVSGPPGSGGFVMVGRARLADDRLAMSRTLADDTPAARIGQPAGTAPSDPGRGG